MKEGYAAAFALLAVTVIPSMAEESYRIGTWNFTNLHHETGVALREGAVARREVD